jgi:hypothetical protein
MEKIPSAKQNLTSEALSYFTPSVKPDPDQFVPSLPPKDTVRVHKATSLPLLMLSLFQERTLKRSASLYSFTGQSKFKVTKYLSATDDSFYPSYLRRPHLVPTSLSSTPITEFDAMSSVSVSRSLIRHITTELPSLGPESTHTAALWERAGWEAMEQALNQPNLSETFMPPPATSLTSQWSAIMMVG